MLFLDFDGVLHPAGVPAGTCMPFEWLPLLSELLEPAPNVLLSIHSSWREVHPLDYLQEFLGGLGDRVVGAVPLGPKEAAIFAFLAKHPEVTDYLILDDSASEFGSVLGARLLVCEPLLGISEYRVQKNLQDWLHL